MRGTTAPKTRLILCTGWLFFFSSNDWASRASINTRTLPLYPKGTICCNPSIKFQFFHGGKVCIELFNTCGKAPGTSGAYQCVPEQSLTKSQGAGCSICTIAAVLADPPNYRQGCSWVVLPQVSLAVNNLRNRRLTKDCGWTRRKKKYRLREVWEMEGRTEPLKLWKWQ